MMPGYSCKQLVAVVATLAGCALLAVGAGVVTYWATGRAFR